VPSGRPEQANARHYAACAVGLAVLSLQVPAALADASRPIELPIRFAVASEQARDPDLANWLETQLAQANRIFASAGVAFERVELVPIDAQHARLRTRADRHALREQVSPRVINCFVVNYLEDVDEPGRERQGVHWHAGGDPDVHYVILSLRAGPDVLAHELGHFFGNPRHSDVPGNIMSYVRGPDLPFFDPRQIANIRRRIRRYLRDGELVLARDLRRTARKPAGADRS
jgi:hypothetical protein